MPIAFNEVGVISGVDGGPSVLNNPTSLQFGHDGRLYVSEQNGSINAFTVSIQDGAYIATDHEQLEDANGAEIVKSIQNHNDDGSEAGQGDRQVTGVVVAGTADEPIVYVSSSDPRISSNGDVNLDTNSGVVTRASFDSATGAWNIIDLVRGLPRSEENHSVNGMVLSEDGTELLLQVGGNTNNGAPSGFFSYTGEYVLSGSTLALDLAALDNLPTQTDPQAGQGSTPRDYKYDLPTLDDPNVENVTDGVGEDANGMDEDGPWGGNDGLNQAILPADAPLRLYSDGFRNPFDIARAPDGSFYTVDNGSNGGLGDVPNTENGDDDGDGVSGEAINTPNDGGFGEAEPLFNIEEGGYYEHANPVRSNQNMAWTVYDDSGNPDQSLTVNTVADISGLVPDGVQIEDGYLIDPSKFATGPGETLADLTPAEREARLLLSGVSTDRDTSSTPIVTVGSSTNGITVYDSGGQAFGGSIDGALFVTQFNDNVTLLNINDAGDGLDPIMSEGPDGIYGTADDVVQSGGGDGVLTVANNAIGIALSNPLDVTVGPNGTLWTAEIVGNEITVLAPGDVILPGDTDGDNDGILNKDDPFMRDATNGASVTITPGQEFLWDFDPNQDGNLPGPGGFGGGLTGVMINGETDFEEFLQSPRDGSNIQLDNAKFITAAGGGTTVIEQVSNGDPFQGGNDGAFLFQTGVTLAPNVGTVNFEWSVFNPVNNAEGPITGDFQQLGGQIGPGDQSNYLKIVAIQTGAGASGIQISLEDGDEIANTQTLTDPGVNVFDGADIPTNAKIFLSLDVDVIAGTATPSATYETTSGDKTLTGAVIDLTGTEVLEAIRGAHIIGGQQSGLAVGLFSTNNGEPEANAFQAVFDDIKITATEAELPPVANDDTTSAQVNQTITIPVADLLANDSDPNGDPLTVTSVSGAANGAAVLDDNGTAGAFSDDFVTFTPDTDFQGQASFGYTISDGDETDDATVAVTVADTTVLYRVNAGGDEIAASANDPYGSDLAWAENNGNGAQSGDGFSVNTGQDNGFPVDARVTEGEFAVADYVPQAVFTSERWDQGSGSEMQFSFGEGSLADGFYTVNLFAGNGFDGTSAPGARIFDVEIEGVSAFTDIDLSGMFGHQVGGMFTWTGQVADGTLDIEWMHQTENPLVNAIEVIGGAVEQPDEPISVSIVNGAAQSVSEADGSVLISLLTSETVPNDESVDVVIEIQGVDATPSADFQYNGGGTFGGGTYIDTVTIGGGSSDFQIPVQILQDAEIEPGEAFTVKLVGVSSNAVLGAVTQATITIEDDDAVTAPGEILFRINAGGPEVAANDGGPAWSGDQGEVANNDAVVGPSSTFLVDREIDGMTTDTSDNVTYGNNPPEGPGANATGAPDALFTTERFSQQANPDNLGYAFNVENGDYTVNLYFDELFFSAENERVFDLEIEGDLVLDDYDTFAVNGNDTGLESFDVSVSDGELNLEFLKTTTNNPHVAAIEIVEAEAAPDPSVVSIAAPDPDNVIEGGDAGVTTLTFPITFDVAPGAPVTIEYSVDIDGAVTSGLTAELSADGSIAVDVPNDALDNGAESVSVTLTGVAAGDATLGAAVTADATVTEDDVAGPAAGEVLFRVNAGGSKVVVGADDGANPGDPDLDWSQDTPGGNSPFLVNPGSNNDFPTNGIPVGTAIATDALGALSAPQDVLGIERWDNTTDANGEMAYAFDVAAGQEVEIRLYFAELFEGVPDEDGSGDPSGDRIFDVAVDGAVPSAFDDIDPYVLGGNSFYSASVATFQTVSDGTINLEFQHGVENPAIKGIEIVAVDGSIYTPPLDTLFGSAVEISDNRLNPTDGGDLADGDNIVTATQEGENGENGVRDRDYFTFEVPQGKILTGIFLDAFTNENPSSPDGFLGIQQGDQLTVDPGTGQPDAGEDGLLGAAIYGSGDVGVNLLDRMAQGGTVDPSTGFSLPAFDPDVTGDVTVWLN